MDKTLQKINMAAASQYGELALSYVTNFTSAFVLLFIGMWLSGFVKRRIVGTGTKYNKLDITLMGFLGSFARYSIIILTLVVVLSQFGVKTTSFIALLGAAGLAIGLALQGTLSNVAAGIMILLYRPFKVGDYIEGADQKGTVKEINLFATELATPENIQVFLPNSQIWGSAVHNFSHHTTRRAEFILGISYEDDIDKAIKVIEGVIAKEDRINKKPEPIIWVNELADSSVNLKVRVWSNSDIFWPLKSDLTKAFKLAFDENNINIPYPTRTIYQGS